jgi:cobalt-zinc-cadmium efflux system membrane fusion protein
MRRVKLEHRFDKTAFVRSKPFDKREQLTAEEKEMGMLPLEPLRPGERILRTGVGELKAALLDLESRPARSKQEELTTETQRGEERPIKDKKSRRQDNNMSILLPASFFSVSVCLCG